MASRTTKPKISYIFYEGQTQSRPHYFVHHTLWGCKEADNSDKQLEDLIFFNDKSHTYFYSSTGTLISIKLTQCSPSLYLDFSWKVGPNPCCSDHFVIILENGGLPSIERVQPWKLIRETEINFIIYAALVCINVSLLILMI